MVLCPLKTAWEGYHRCESKTKLIRFGIYKYPLFQWGPFWQQPGFLHEPPQEDDGLLFSWSACYLCFTGEGMSKKQIAKGSNDSDPGQSCPFNNELACAITLYNLWLIGGIQGSSYYLKNPHASHVKFPTYSMKGKHSMDWCRDPSCQSIATSLVSSDPRPSPSPVFLPLATRRPFCAPPTCTRGRALQRSWWFPECQCCFSWNSYRQALEDCRAWHRGSCPPADIHC